MRSLFLMVCLQTMAAAQQAVVPDLDLSKLNQPHLESRFGAPIQEWFISRSGDLVIARYGADKQLWEGELKPNPGAKSEQQHSNLELLLSSIFAGYDRNANYSIPPKSLENIENISGEKSCLNYEIERVEDFFISHHNYGCVEDPKAGVKVSVLRRSDWCRLDVGSPQSRAQALLPSARAVSGSQVINSEVLREQLGRPVEETFAVDKTAQLAVTYGRDGQACKAQLSGQEPLLRSFTTDEVYLDSQKSQTTLTDLGVNYEADRKGCFEAYYGAPWTRMCILGKTRYEQQFQGKELVRVVLVSRDQDSCKGIPGFE